jgi:uncharacterized membrane protein
MISRRRHTPLPEWVVPLCCAAIAVPLGALLPRLEHRFIVSVFSSTVSVAAALTILSSITSRMVALTGIVFSLEFVIVQFSAVAYSPQLVSWLSRAPVIWHSIGVFTVTFLYAIGDVVWIDHAASGRVPFFSSLLVIVLTLASVGMFVALIQRIALLQISSMLAFTGNLGRRVIEELYPPLTTPARVAEIDEFTKYPVTQTVVHYGELLALQFIDTPALLALATRSGGCVEVMASVGDTLFTGMPLLRVSRIGPSTAVGASTKCPYGKRPGQERAQSVRGPVSMFSCRRSS